MTSASDEKWRPFNFFFSVGSGEGLVSTPVSSIDPHEFTTGGNLMRPEGEVEWKEK